MKKNFLYSAKHMEEEPEAERNYNTDFLACMSHELRTPLNVIIGLTNLLLEEEGLPEHIRNNHLSISKAGGVLHSILDNILDISKIDSGKLTFTPVDYHLRSLLNDCIALIKNYIGENPIDFIVHIPENLPGMLHGDETRVKQIINNLLINAVKYTRKGSVELYIECGRDGDAYCLEIRVKGSGIGISPETLANLYSDDFHADICASCKTADTWLGLSITKRLAEMMGGGIRAESELGKGNTIIVHIMQGCVDNEDLSNARVLVVDDMQNNLYVASELMRKYNIKVDCLTGGMAAVEQIKSGTPVYNAVFMDHMMPGMDGVEAVKAIRNLDTDYAKTIPIIALTGNTINGTEQFFLGKGFQDCLFKPIDIMLLDTTLKKWVRNLMPENLSGINRIPKAEEDGTIIEIPGIDAKRGLSHYGNDTEIYISILRSYALNTPWVLDQLKGITEENLPEGVILAHGIKGSSANICAEKVRAAAAEMEAMARIGESSRFFALRGPLLQDTLQLVATISAWLHTYEKSCKKSSQPAPNRALLQQLREACQSFDMTVIDQALDELERANYDSDGDLVTWLREKIDISELEEVIIKLGEYLHG